MTKPLYLLFVALAVALGGGCSRPEESEGPGATKSAAALTIKGSDTMLHLVTACSEAYLDAHPEADISTTGGGSGTGIAALLNGTTGICMSSRNINPEEQQTAAEKGIKLEEVVIGRDGIAIGVNPANPIPSLTLAQLQQIFTGEVENWSEVGGPDQAITLLSRENSSGTYVFFAEHVLNKKDFSTSARLLPANPAIVQALQSDQWSIGYIGLGYAMEAGNSIKVVPVAKDAQSPSVLPTNETVLSGQYPIARTLQFYVPEEAGPLARDFIDFCLSPAGQEIVRASGYVPLK